MPLLVDGKPLEKALENISEFLEKSPTLKANSASLRDQPVQEIGPAHLLYVNQREFAVISQADENVHVIGTDDATTCHICVLRHSGSNVFGLGHFDGVDTETGVVAMVDTIQKLSLGHPDGRLELHLMGGFCDGRHESDKISCELLDIFTKRLEEVHLLCTCIGGINDVLKEGIHYPVIYGIGVNVKTGEIFPASFPDKGPSIYVRSATHFVGFKKMLNIYDNSTSEFRVGPYSWEPWQDIDMWVSLPDRVIRRYLSTSPEQEPERFASNVRAALEVIQVHPEPHKTLFPDNKPLRYAMDSGGLWQPILDTS